MQEKVQGIFARPVQVCHLGKYYPPAPGGIESHVQTLARAQRAAGAEVRVVCVNHRNRLGEDVTWSRTAGTQTLEEADHGVRVTRLGRRASVARLDIIPGLPRLLLDLQYSPIDIIHLHTPNPTMLLTLAGLRLSKPIVVTHHSDVISQRWLVHLMRPLERIVYSRARAILCSSEAYADASAVLSRYERRIAIVPLGSDLQPFLDPSSEALAEARRWRDLAGGAPMWLCVGRCVYYKGLHTAIRALREVPGRLVIIGHGPMRQYLEKLAQELGVADRVTFTGFATDAQLAGAYLAATALWFPSNARSEAFGLVQIEAMASGCPVINTHIQGSGVDWVSVHGQSGLTIPVEDPVSLAGAARRLLDEPGLRERLSRDARRRAIQDFDQHRMARRTLDVYARVIQEAQSGGRATDVIEPAPARLQAWVNTLANETCREPRRGLTSAGV